MCNVWCIKRDMQLNFQRISPKADYFIESQCPFIGLFVPFSCNFLAWIKSALAWSPKNGEVFQIGRCTKLIHSKLLGSHQQPLLGKVKTAGQGCGFRASSGGSLKWQLKPGDSQLVLLTKLKAEPWSWLLVLQVGFCPHFHPLPCHWPLGSEPLDDDDGWVSGVGVRLLWSKPPNSTAMGSTAECGFMSGVGVTLLRIKPHHGTAMGSHP